MRIEFNGNLIDVQLGKFDFVGQYGTDSLVYFSSEDGTDQVFVDEQASESYCRRRKGRLMLISASKCLKR